MEIRYTDGPDALNIEPKDGTPFFTAERGKWVDVPDTLATRNLVAQGWERKTPAKTKTDKEG